MNIMARNSRKKALYEVIGVGRKRSSIEQIPYKSPTEDTDKDSKKPEAASSPIKWPQKPKIAQLNQGRIELSLPYPLAITALMVTIVLLMLVFRLGQLKSSNQASVGSIPLGTGQTENIRTEQPAAGNTSPGRETTAGTTAAVTQPDNIIVIVQYQKYKDLVPVQKHFADYGVETKIISIGKKYFLITKDKFNSFKTGTPGQRTLEQIREIGPRYKGRAPQGYEAFAPNYFTDAYPMKIEQ